MHSDAARERSNMTAKKFFSAFVIAFTVIVSLISERSSNALVIGGDAPAISLRDMHSGVDCAPSELYVADVEIDGRHLHACKVELSCQLGMEAEFRRALCITSAQNSCPDWRSCMEADYSDVLVVQGLVSLTEADFRRLPMSALTETIATPFPAGLSQGLGQIGLFASREDRLRCLAVHDAASEATDGADLFDPASRPAAQLGAHARQSARTLRFQLRYERVLTAQEESLVTAWREAAQSRFADYDTMTREIRRCDEMTRVPTSDR